MSFTSYQSSFYMRDYYRKVLLCEIVSPKNDRKDTHSTSKTWLLKQYLKKDNMNRHVWCGKSFCICCVYWLMDNESDLSCDRVE